MQISARVENRRDQHQVTLRTNGQSHTLATAPKSTGLGSSANGGELLALALATCYCNDLYREAAGRDIGEMHRVRMSVRENRLADPALIQPHDYAILLTSAGRGWVAEVDGRVAGFAVADRVRWNVWALFVHPLAEGRGMGRRLHDAMMDWFFAEADAERVWLGTDPGTRAERFYQAAGWRSAGPAPNGEARYEMSREQWLRRPGD